MNERPQPDQDEGFVSFYHLYKEIYNMDRIFNSRLDAMEDKFRIFHELIMQNPIERDKRLASLESVILEKFEGVDIRFEASLNAVAKSELSFEKQIDSLNTIVNSAIQSLDDKIGEDKERLTRLESGSTGSAAYRLDSQRSVGILISGVAVLIALLSPFLAILAERMIK